MTDTEDRSRIQVLHVTPEMAPLSKVGGLADVAGSLPSALCKLGADVRVMTPSWPGVLERLREVGAEEVSDPTPVCVLLKRGEHWGSVRLFDLDGLKICLLEHHDLFSLPQIYPEHLDPVSVMPFAFLSLAALEYSLGAGWRPHILHLHDWPTSLGAAALRWHLKYAYADGKPRTVLTIHNMAHQGTLPLSVLNDWDMGPGSFSIDGVEFYGAANLLKGGIASSDAITTVSPNYAREIMSPDFGEGLEGVLEYRKDKVTGILNGIDTAAWDPATDDLIPAQFSIGDMKGKKICHASLLSECGWAGFQGPVLVSVGRLVRQKGMEILLDSLDDILGSGARIAVIGTGEGSLETRFLTATTRNPDGLHYRAAFDEHFARLAYAGGDMFLMPSLFEPCGLSQMISMRYGTVPVVRAVGGLADTVTDVDAGPRGTGFAFEDFAPEALTGAVKRALVHFAEPRRWVQLRKRCMERDFSWDSSARTYMSLYGSLITQQPFITLGGNEHDLRQTR